MRPAGNLLFASAILFGLSSSPAQADSVTLPGGKKIENVDFERHVMALFGKMGCNAGSCHGSFQGKGGFRLSLFGYDPAMDYIGVTRDGSGRRVNPADVDRSLILLKATGQINHDGLRRFDKDSWQYRLLREWIAGGMKWQSGSGKVKSVKVTPAEYAVKQAGDRVQLSVEVTFSDGTTEDVTPLCDFRVNDDLIAGVSSTGELITRQAGDTAVIVSYRGQVVPVRVLVPLTPPKDFKYTQVPEVNYIDREVFAKLRRLNIQPSDLCSDSEFLRRVTIDTIGCLPTADEVRKFLASTDPNKREKKIDELLAHPMHAALWATKFCDILGNATDQLENPVQSKAKRSQMWHDWLRKRLAANVPYDQLVHDILCATTREGMSPEDYVKQSDELEEAISRGWKNNYADRKTLDLFWRRQQQVPVDQWGQKMAVAFLGVRLECAECHKHPFDRWTQEDYRAWANLFANVSFGIAPESAQAFNAATAERRKKAQRNNQVAVLREVFISSVGRTLPHPETNASLPPRLLGGPEVKAERGKDLRKDVWAWMVSKDNPFFARSFANRVWGHYLGVGIVHPVDDFSLANPPSNEKLLDALARDFIDSKFDIRKLEKRILMSRTYQLSSSVNATNHLDRNNYSHAYIRPLMAEVVVDVINSALGTTENWGNDAPAGSRAIEVGSSRVTGVVQTVFQIFGRPARAVACDCERSPEPTVAHKLFLMADPLMQNKLSAARARVQELLRKNLSDDKLIEELVLSTLSRFPTEREKTKVKEFLAGKRDRQAACTDVLWVLLNTTEFIFNH